MSQLRIGFTITTIALNEDQRVIIGGHNGQVRMINPRTMCFERKLLGHFGAITCSTTADWYGGVVITGCVDTTVRVWSFAHNGDCVHVLKGHTNRVNCVAIHSHRLVWDTHCAHWTLQTGVGQ